MIPHDKVTNLLPRDGETQPNRARLTEELYRKLSMESNRLTTELGRPVSIREALLGLIESLKLEPKDMSWSWRIKETSTNKNPS